MSDYWMPMPLASVDATTVGYFYPAAVANGIGFDVLLCAVAVGSIMSLLSHMALLIARRRRALIAYGVAQGFYKVLNQRHEETTASASHRRPAATTVAQGARATLPDASAEVVTAAKSWDSSCAMIYEGGHEFSEPLETIALMTFFTRPLFAQVYAAFFACYRLCIVVLDASKCVVSVRLAAAALALPCGGVHNDAGIVCRLLDYEPRHHVDAAIILACFAMACGARVLQTKSASADAFVTVAHRTARLVAVLSVLMCLAHETFGLLSTGSGGLFSRERAAQLAVVRQNARELAWLWAIKACALTFESHGATPGAFSAAAPSVSTAPSGSKKKLDHASYTFGANKRLVRRAVTLAVMHAVVVLAVSLLAHIARPHFDGSAPLPAAIASDLIAELDRETAAEARQGPAQIQQWFGGVGIRVFAAILALAPLMLVLLGLADGAVRVAAMTRYLFRGTPRSWDHRDIPFRSPLVSIAINAAVHGAHWRLWVPALFVSGVAVAHVFPFVLWRWSRLEARRLNIPRQLDDALRLTPAVSRAATAVGAAWLAIVVIAAFGVGEAPPLIPANISDASLASSST